MKNIKSIYVFIILITSVSAYSQSVTFQSYMETVPWAEQVLLNGNPLTETSEGVFEIDPTEVLPGKNTIEFISSPVLTGNITSADLNVIRKAILEISPLDPLGIVLADVDNSHFVGTADYIKLINHILGVEALDITFKFVHSEFDFSTFDIFDFGVDMSKFCFNQSELNDINFVFDVGILCDANLSSTFQPTKGNVSEVRSDNLIMSVNDIDIIADSNFEIPFSFNSEKEIEMMQMQIDNEGMTILSVEMDKVNDEAYINNTIDGQTQMVLVSDSPSKEFKGIIHGTSTKNAKLSDAISISTNFLDEVVYNDLSISGISIEFGTTSVDDDFRLENLIISPNPILDHFTIQVPPSLLDKSTFTITNTQGQVLMTQSNLKGNLVLDKNDIGTSGTYILTWNHGVNVVHKKLVVL